MAATSLAAPDLSVLIQVQHSVPSGTRGLLSSGVTSVSRSGQSDMAASESADGHDAAKVKEAANKFEALLIHNMLKSMRKTTMAENTSNQKALYDDMLDEQLAETMMEAGGLGIAKQLVSELQGPQKTEQTASISPTNRARLRELAFGSDKVSASGAVAASLQNARTNGNQSDAQTQVNGSLASTTDIASLRMASGLWGQEGNIEKRRSQLNFLQPLLPHAQRSAEQLGTSPNAVLAIAALETGWGQSMLKDEAGQSAHNYFGIKAASLEHAYTSNTTTEFINGKPEKTVARFRTFENPADAMQGFTDFLLTNPRYSTALQNANNPEQFLKELHNAGYATDPKYADKAISVLHQIDRHLSPL